MLVLISRHTQATLFMALLPYRLHLFRLSVPHRCLTQCAPLPLPYQGACLQSETSFSLHINLSERGDRPGDLDKLKPYILEHILVLLMAPAPGPSSAGGWIRIR